MGKPSSFSILPAGTSPDATKVGSVVIGSEASACSQQQYVRWAHRHVVSLANWGSIWNDHALQLAVCEQIEQQSLASFASWGPLPSEYRVLLYFTPFDTEHCGFAPGCVYTVPATLWSNTPLTCE